jgi:hypothetical protein
VAGKSDDFWDWFGIQGLKGRQAVRGFKLAVLKDVRELTTNH